MDLISKSVFVGGIYLAISIIYANLPLTKKKIKNFNDQELFQKNEKFKSLWKIFLIIGFFSPIVMTFPLFFVSISKIVNGYLAILVLVVLFAVATGMMYLSLAKITTGEIEYRRKIKEK